MNRLLWSAAAGAAAMYFLDPQSGRRRRARTRGKAESAARRVRDAYEVTTRDTAQRVHGLLAETQGWLRREPVSDEVLASRVRACLGRYVSHPHAIEVAASDGRVTLSGPILAHEVKALIAAVRHVRGVGGVVNRLEAHTEPGDISSLQGGVERRGQRFELLQENWSPAARLAIGTLGLMLLMRRGLAGRIGGAALLARAASNLDFAALVGASDASRGIEVHKTICIDAPVDMVYAFWADYQNFPRFMSNVLDVRALGGRSEWVVNGPGGVPVRWTSEVVRMEPDSRIEWRSSADSAIKQEGCVCFEPTDDGGTRVSVELCYLPPAGALGHAIAALFGADPKSEMDADLMRMKSMIETGKRPHDAAQPA